MTDFDNKNLEDRVRFVATHYKEGMFDSRKAWKKTIASLPGFGKARRVSLVIRLAAAAVLLLAVGIGVLMTVNRPHELMAYADNTEFTLPDQTEVVMQQGAQLTYDRHFGHEMRAVSMRGEITFAVMRNEEKPFVVSTPAAKIKVLGTKFTVAETDKDVKLTVESGLVQFTPNEPVIPLLCTAGARVHYMADAKRVEVTSPHGNMSIDGSKNELNFNNIPLKEVALVLSHYFNTAVQLPEEEAAIPFTSSFTNKSIIEIINIINFTLDTHLTSAKGAVQ